MSHAERLPVLELLPAGEIRDAVPSLQRERRLAEVAEALCLALDSLHRARGGAAALRGFPQLPELYAELRTMQAHAADELGRTIGARVAASRTWTVRTGIDVPDLD